MWLTFDGESREKSMKFGDLRVGAPFYTTAGIEGVKVTSTGWVQCPHLGLDDVVGHVPCNCATSFPGRGTVHHVDKDMVVDPRGT